MYKSKMYKYETQQLRPMNDDEFMEMVEENHNILKSCKNHEFEELCTKTYVCKNCGGIIDKCNLYWYELGKEHVKNNYDTVGARSIYLGNIYIPLEDPIQGFLMTNAQIRSKDEFRNPSKLNEVSEMIQAGRQNSG